MQTPTPPSSTFVSPITKRKRPISSTTDIEAPSPSRIRTTNLPSRPILEDSQVADGSPRTAVAGHLQSLDLEEVVIPADASPSFGMARRSSSDRSPAPTAPFAPHVSLPPGQTFHHDRFDPTTPPTSSHTLAPQQQQQPPGLEVPETPHLQPTTTVPPCPDDKPLHPPTTSRESTAPQPAPAPPLSPVPQYPNTLWWTDTEITGHSPSDPTDDGYGINGVGFVPTPAMASVRAEKRKRQVRDWKEREAREARAKRGERRRRARGDSGGAAVMGTGREMGKGMEVVGTAKMGEQEKRVKFLEV